MQDIFKQRYLNLFYNHLGDIYVFFIGVLIMYCYVVLVFDIVGDEFTAAVLVHTSLVLYALTAVSFMCTRIMEPPPLGPLNSVSDWMQQDPMAADWERFCCECQTFRPERAYHCYRCQRCIVRMEKHSQFFGQCIHQGNSKPAALTALYGLLLSLGVFAISWHLLSIVDYDCTFYPNVILFFAGITAVGCTHYLEGAITTYITNSTPMERQSFPQLDRNYDTGNWLQNVKTFMGSNVWLWLLPWVESRE